MFAGFLHKLCWHLTTIWLAHVPVVPLFFLYNNCCLCVVFWLNTVLISVNGLLCCETLCHFPVLSSEIILGYFKMNGVKGLCMLFRYKFCTNHSTGGADKDDHNINFVSQILKSILNVIIHIYLILQKLVKWPHKNDVSLHFFAGAFNWCWWRWYRHFLQKSKL